MTAVNFIVVVVSIHDCGDVQRVNHENYLSPFCDLPRSCGEHDHDCGDLPRSNGYSDYDCSDLPRSFGEYYHDCGDFRVEIV